MISPLELENYLDSLLDVHSYKDASYNGIQVQGIRQEIRRLATGVTASSALLAAAGKADVDAVLTHHGLFWQGQDPRIRGGFASRIRHLVKNDMTLLAYHLPIDGHHELGNNSVLAKELSLEDTCPWGDYHGATIGVLGSCPKVEIGDLVRQLSDTVGREVLHLPGGPEKVERVAIVSGGAAGMALAAARDGAEVFITGEPSEPSMHVAAEEGIHILAAGHHHTETFGVQAVGDHLSKELGIDVLHIDLPNPV